MKFFIATLLIVGLSSGCYAKKVDDPKIEDDKRTDKRGAVEIQGGRIYATTSPAISAVSHGPSILSAVTGAPGIVYAPEKQIIATASPSQLYAKPSPHIAKVSDAVIAGHQQTYSGLVSNQLYQQAPQAYTKLGYVAPTYAVSAPIPSQLAYSKHQIYPQQVYAHQQQVAIPQQHIQYQITQPQYSHVAQAQQQIAYVHQPQVNYHQPQVYHAQPQVYHAQPQVYHAQPQVYQAQAQVYHAQPQAYHHAQPQVYQSQHVYDQPQATIEHTAYTPAHTIGKVAYVQPTYSAQSVANKGEGAVSYASFSQGHGTQYSSPKVNYNQALVAVQPVEKQVVAPVYQHYQQPQVYSSAHSQEYVQPQVYSSHAKVAYAQPQVSYSPQYYGKLAQGNAVAYSGYTH